MRKAGIRVEVVRYPRSLFGRLLFLLLRIARKQRVDVCMVQKRLVSALELQLMRRFAARLVFDFDDAIWTGQEEPKLPGGGSLWHRFASVTSKVDLVVAGNRYLASAVTGGTPVCILPTPLDTECYTPARLLAEAPQLQAPSGLQPKHPSEHSISQQGTGAVVFPDTPMSGGEGRSHALRGTLSGVLPAAYPAGDGSAQDGPAEDDPVEDVVGKDEARTTSVRVGWMGTRSYLQGLSEVAPIVRKVSGRPLLVVSNAAPEGVLAESTEFARWTSDDELSLLRRFAVGLMPLEDTPYTRGKCGFKLLQYMACGAVPVASDVGFNREVITHGVDGFLVRKPEEWTSYIDLLLRDAPLRERMAAAARVKVVEHFDVRPMTARMLEAIAAIPPRC